METDRTPITVPALQQMKRDGRKIVGVVAWDYPMAQIVDRAGADLVSVGDTVGVNLWGHASPLEITLAEMLVVCKAVRRGVKRALVSCDFPFGPLQEGADSAVRAAILLVKEGGRGHGEAGWGGGLSRGGARRGSRGHTRVCADGHYAADRAAIWRAVQRGV